MGLRGNMRLCDNFRDIFERLGPQATMQRSAYHKISNLVAKSKNRICVIPKILRSQLRDVLTGAEAKKQEQKNGEVPGGEDPGEHSGSQKSKGPGIPTLLCTSNWQKDLKSSCETRNPSATRCCVTGPSKKDVGASAETTKVHHEKPTPSSRLGTNSETCWLHRGVSEESAQVQHHEPTSSFRNDTMYKTTRWLLDHHSSTEASESAEKCCVIGPWMEFVGASAKNCKGQHEEPTPPLRINTNCGTTRWLHDGSTSSSQPCLSQARMYQLAPDFEPRARKKHSAQVKSKGRRHKSLVRGNVPRSHSWHRPLGSTKLSRSTKQHFKEDKLFQVHSWLTTLDFNTLCKVMHILQNNNTEYEQNEDDKSIRILQLLNRARHASPMTRCRSHQKVQQRSKSKSQVCTYWKPSKQNLHLSRKKRKRCDYCMRREACSHKKKPRIDRVEGQTCECQRRHDSSTARRRWQRKARRRKHQLRHKTPSEGIANSDQRTILQTSERKRKKSMTELDADGSTSPPKWQHLHIAAFLDESDVLEVIQNSRRRSLHWFQRLAKYPRKYYKTIPIPSRDIRTWRRWIRANGDPCN